MHFNYIILICQFFKKFSIKYKKTLLIHISTDYVFDGNSSVPLKEDTITAPLNIYGLTKLEGEKVCLKNDPNWACWPWLWHYYE